MPGYLQMLVPGVAAQVLDVAKLAWTEAGWDDDSYGAERPDPASLGFRTNEHLLYQKGGVLSAHLDTESMYTVVTALSRPEEYQGGEWVLFDNYRNELQRIKLGRFSAVVFLSSIAEHGVSAIEGGNREVLAIEMWENADAPFNELRPTIEQFYEAFPEVAVPPEAAVATADAFSDEL
jgi:hypothetical protein